MTTGTSRLIYPEQPVPQTPITIEDSYLLVRLHHAQAFYAAGWLIRPALLSLTSKIQSSFLQGQPPIENIHQFASLRKNTPTQLGVQTNLTDWLPARPTDWIRLELTYVVLQDTPFQDVMTKMNGLGLNSQLSLLRPELAAAGKISTFAAQLLSVLLGEGRRHDIFGLHTDLNIASLKTGYWVAISGAGEQHEKALRCDEQGAVTGADGKPLTDCSYVVLQILAVPRRGQELARGMAWWHVLEEAKERAVQAVGSAQLRALDEWLLNLRLVRQLARQEPSYLIAEISDIIRAAHVEVENQRHLSMAPEGSGTNELPNVWRDVLDVNDTDELFYAVQSYADLLKQSKPAMDHVEDASGNSSRGYELSTFTS